MVAWAGSGVAEADDGNPALPEPLAGPFTTLPQPLGTADREAWEWEVVWLVNQERANNGGLPPLKRVAAIDASAYGHSYDMGVNNFFSHTGSDGSLPWDRMRAQGYYYSSAGENIAAGYSSPVWVMQGWMNSSGHRANILSASYRELGVGYFYDDPATYPGPWGYGHYWTQNFGRRSGVYPVVINREAYSTTNPIVDLYVYGPGDATQMRFSNDGANWSAWQPYATDTVWALSEGNRGPRTVYAQVGADSGTYEVTDEILYAPPSRCWRSIHWSSRSCPNREAEAANQPCAQLRSPTPGMER